MGTFEFVLSVIIITGTKVTVIHSLIKNCNSTHDLLENQEIF